MSTTIKRKDLEALQDAFGKLACVQPKEGETPSWINRIAYAAGKNYNRSRDLAIETETKQLKILGSFEDADFVAFQKKHAQTCEDNCKREDDGSPMIERSDDGSSKYVFAKGREEECAKAVTLLLEEYKDAIAHKNANVAEADAVLEEDVEFDVYTIVLPVDDPFSGLPQGASGSYIDIAKAMFVNLPDMEE